MSDIQQLGKTVQLSNCSLTRVDVDTEHYYFSNNKYFLSLTHVLDIAAPFPEGLRNWLRNTDGQESLDYMNMTKDRGSKLHRALEELFYGWELTLADYPTKYEKEAIVSFIRCMRFLQPTKWKTELVVADPSIRVAGTMDLWVVVDKRRLDMLEEPNKYLTRTDDSFEVRDKYKVLLKGKPKLISCIVDYKFTGRSTYNHKVQVTSYKHMFNLGYKDLPRATRAYIWRYSASHKNRYVLEESVLPYSSFKRIHATCLDYLGSFPEPPDINVYPDQVRLFEVTNKEEVE